MTRRAESRSVVSDTPSRACTAMSSNVLGARPDAMASRWAVGVVNMMAVEPAALSREPNVAMPLMVNVSLPAALNTGNFSPT